MQRILFLLVLAAGTLAASTNMKTSTMVQTTSPKPEMTTTMSPKMATSNMSAGVPDGSVDYFSVCNDTYKVSSDLMDQLNMSGRFKEENDQTAMCYIHCVLDMSKIIDMQGYFDEERAIMFVKKMKSSMDDNKIQDMIKTCIEEQDKMDLCVRSYGFLKCVMAQESNAMLKQAAPKSCMMQKN